MKPVGLLVSATIGLMPLAACEGSHAITASREYPPEARENQGNYRRDTNPNEGSQGVVKDRTGREIEPGSLGSDE